MLPPLRLEVTVSNNASVSDSIEKRMMMGYSTQEGNGEINEVML